MKRLVFRTVALWALCGPAVSLAQTAPLTIEAGRADRAPPITPSPAQAPPQKGRVVAATPSFSPFEMRGLAVEGSTLPKPAIEAVGRPFIGQRIDEPTLTRIAEAMGKLYADSDIALYTVLAPRQSGAEGLVRLVAVEGYISQVDLQAKNVDPSLSRRYAERLKAERPLTKAGLQRYVGLMRDVPGAHVDLQFLQGGSPGAVRLQAKTRIDRVQTGLSINNRGATLLGRTQIEASLMGNSLLREGDQTRLTFAAPTDWERFQYVALAHTEPLGASGATLTVTGGKLWTRPDIAGFEVRGSATTGSALVAYPVIRSNQKNLYVTGSFDGVDSDNALFGRRLSREQTRVLRAAASYVQQSPKQVVSVYGAVSQGLDAFGAKASPFSGDSEFTKLNLQGAFNRQVGQRFVLRLSANGQYADSRTPGPEQYSIGGAQFGRAFASSVVTGDSGYAVLAEIAWRPPVTPKVMAGSELYAYADQGEAWSKARPAGDRGVSLASAGGGVRMAWASKGVVEVEVGVPLDAPAGVSDATRLMLNLRTLL